MEKEYKFVSAVIYIHNEQKYIQEFVQMIYKYLNDRFYKFEIICVDDASSDSSISKVQQIVEENRLTNVSLISMDIYQGREASMEAGVDFSIGDYVYELEWIDLVEPEHYVKLLWNAYKTALSGFDIVSTAAPKPSNIQSKIFYKIYNKFNLNYTPLTPERFRIVTRRAINRVSNLNNSIVYRKALFSNCGLKSKVLEYTNGVPVQNSEKNVQKNKSKLGTHVLLAYTTFIQKVSEGIVFLNILNLLITSCLIIFNLARGDIVSEISLLWLGISILSVAISAIILFALKYLELILGLLLRKENYIVGAVSKLENSERER